MTTGKIFYRSWMSERNPDNPPEWAKFCERWYQLDEAAFALTDAFHHTLDLEQLKDMKIFLSCPFSSNRSDWNFVQKGALSPALFVHTLPNVRLSSALQISGTHNNFLCLMDKNHSASSAAREALFSTKQTGKATLLIHCEEGSKKHCKIHILEVSPPSRAASLIKTPITSVNWKSSQETPKHPIDETLQDFLTGSGREAELKIPNFSLTRTAT